MRAVLDESGRLTTWTGLPTSVPGHGFSLFHSLPSASEALAQLNLQLGIQGEDPQYIAAGGTLGCRETVLCLAFRKAELAYLSTGGRLFEVSANGPRLTVGAEAAPAPARALLRSLRPTERLVSLSGKRFTIARQVDPSMVRQGISAFAP